MGDWPDRDARRKIPAERHRELLDCAVKISRRDGLAAVTLRKVATELGVTAGLVSHYFNTAEQLVVATFDQAASSDLAEVKRRIGAEQTSLGKLGALITGLLDDEQADTQALWLEAWSLGRRIAALSERIQALNEEWLELVASIVGAGVAEGDFHVDDIAMAPLRLLAMMDGLGAQMVIRSIPVDELRRIAYAYAESELGIHAKLCTPPLPAELR
jgi:AcrR family transcriptional regulator